MPKSVSKLLLPLFAIGLVRSAAAQSPGERAFAKTILQLNAASIQVVNKAQLSLDSALILASRYRRIDPVPVIIEGIDDNFSRKYSGWLNDGRIDSFIMLLSHLNDSALTEGRLLAGAWFAHQPGRANYRKAIAFLEQAKAGAEWLGRMDWEAHCYCLLSKTYYMLDDTVSGNRWLFSLINNPAFSGFEPIQTKARNNAGLYYPFRPNTTRFRLDCLAAAQEGFKRDKDTGNQINTLMDISYLSFAAGNFGASEEAAKQSLRLQDLWHFPYTQYSYDLLAFLEIFHSDYVSAIRNSLLALNATTATADRQFLPGVLNRLGLSCLQLNNKQSATEWFQKALQAEIAVGGDINLYTTLDQFANLSTEIDATPNMLTIIRNTLNRYPPSNPSELQEAYETLSDCYRNLNEHSEALHYMQLAWALEPETTLSKGGLKSGFLIQRMGLVNLDAGNYREARKYFLLLISRPFDSTIQKLSLVDSYYELHLVDSALGHYRSALHWLSLFDELKYSLFGDKQYQQLQDLNVKYATLQRENQLNELRNKNRRQLQMVATTQKLYFGAFVFLGFVIVMIYVRYRNNKRMNRRLRSQKEKIDQQNGALQQLNRQQTVLIGEKEWLLREIHHRIKNNLQTITSLLLSQAEFLRDQAAVDIMLESQRRVHAMSLIHQKLYNSDNLSSIYMPEYIGELVDYLRECFSMQYKVAFHLQIDPIRLDLSKAVPLGLILNEVITNAFKYAFPHTANDHLYIRLFADGQFISLEVEDNGSGLPPDFDLTAGNSFGMILMRGMAEDLEGTFTAENARGTRVVLRFPQFPLERTVAHAIS